MLAVACTPPSPVHKVWDEEVECRHRNISIRVMHDKLQMLVERNEFFDLLKLLSRHEKVP